MMSHTKEPWDTDGFSSVGATGSDQFNGGFFTATCEGPDKIANAKRIVACVNACAGSSTEWLEFSVSEDCADLSGPFQPIETRITSILKAGLAYMVERDQMRQQRDDLLAALKSVNESAVCFAKNEYSISADAISKVENAIAGVEGGAA